MAAPRPSAKLSKSILEMKFMRRTKDKVRREEEDEKSRAMYSGEITDKMLKGECPFIVETSYVPCENLSDGRYSFRGMNPEIERIIQLETAEIDAAKDKNVTKDVTDVEMSASYYQNVKKTIERKFQSKNQRRRHRGDDGGQRPQFKKPKMDDEWDRAERRRVDIIADQKSLLFL